MAPTFRKSMAWLHTWAGVVIGSVLFAIFWMGSLSVFDREIDRWMMPGTRLAPALVERSFKLDGPITEQAQLLTQGASQWFISLPSERMPAVELRWRNDASKTTERRYFHPQSGAVLEHTDTLAGTGFIFPFHFSLHLKWLDLGHWLVGLAGMAMLMGAATLDPDWHEQVLGASPNEAAVRGTAGAARFRLEELIFARWVMVVVNFERAMYEDPSRDLNAEWWDLVQKYQLLNKPAGRERHPDWAAKYHIALAPAYYQNYLLGRMMSLQWTGWLTAHAGGIIGRPDAGKFFMQRIFAPGATMHWNDALEFATGEKLNPDYFVQKFAY